MLSPRRMRVLFRNTLAKCESRGLCLRLGNRGDRTNRSDLAHPKLTNAWRLRNSVLVNLARGFLLILRARGPFAGWSRVWRPLLMTRGLVLRCVRPLSASFHAYAARCLPGINCTPPDDGDHSELPVTINGLGPSQRHRYSRHRPSGAKECSCS
jgi:hypothetical protein